MTNSAPQSQSPTELSRRKVLALLPDEERDRIVAEFAQQAGLSVERMVERIREDWRFNARPKQIAPDGDWMFWFIRAGRGFGKLLDVDTPIPTPVGWMKLGDLQVGDLVFDESGRTAPITAVYDDVPQRAYRVRFSDGTFLDAGGEHLWTTWDRSARRAFCRSAYEDKDLPAEWPAWKAKRATGRILPREVVEMALDLVRNGSSARAASRHLGVTRQALARHLRAGRYLAPRPQEYDGAPGPAVRATDEIALTLRQGKRGDLNHSIPVTLPLDLAERDLPLDPYVLGAWLGDGSRGSGQFTADPSDHDHWYRELAEFSPHSTSDEKTVATFGLYRRLKEIGVLSDKRVPDEYLRGSISQRLALLQGLMDTDGSASAASVEFSNTNRRLIDAVIELARSLGQKPVVAEARAKLNGKDCGPYWRVTWRPTVPIFRLERKAQKIAAPGLQASRNRHRMILACDPIHPRPMRCLTVASRHHLFLAGEGMIPTHNTLSAAEWIKEKVEQPFLARPDDEGVTWRVALVAPTLGDVRVTMVEGEALALDTVVQTPTGHTTMGELQEGDLVLGGDGAPCRVVHAHPVLLDRPCYRVRLKGGAEVIADAAHRWLTEDYACRAHTARHGSTSRRPEVVTTEEMLATLRHYSGSSSQANHGIRTAAFWAYDADLPIDPYVLGAWLGDGLSKAGAICDADGGVIAEVERAGYETRFQPSSTTVPVYGVLGLQAQLREAGLLQNKHVPPAYLRASVAQRFGLVQGLMDTDGYVSERGQCEFVSSRRELAESLVDLLCGLGVKASAPRPKATRLGGTHWLVKFTTTFPVFRLGRKVERLPERYRDADHWFVAEVESTESVPVRCITVDSPDQTYLVTRHYIRTHNTGLLSILPPSLLRGGTRDSAWNRGTCELYLANGTYMKGYSSDVPERLRGPQHHYGWGEECSSWLDAKLGDTMGSGKDSTFTNLKLGLRLGETPQAALTSTPKANKLTKDLLALPALVTSIGSSLENRDNLSELWWRTVVEPLIGTRTGRQEVFAEVLDDVEGALWSSGQLDQRRIPKAPELHRIVVAVDPNASAEEASNDAGIIVCGRENNFGRRAYVLADRTITRGGPSAWAQAAVDAYYEFDADRIVAEKNNGGEMVRLTIKTVDPTVPVKLVTASRGKRVRAEPVAALYEERPDHPLGRVFHVGPPTEFAALEEQMTTWTPEAESPDRMDALVWGCSELMLGPSMQARSSVPKGRLPIPR